METPRHNASPSLALHKEPEVAVGTTSANGSSPATRPSQQSTCWWTLRSMN